MKKSLTVKVTKNASYAVQEELDGKFYLRKILSTGVQTNLTTGHFTLSGLSNNKTYKKIVLNK